MGEPKTVYSTPVVDVIITPRKLPNSDEEREYISFKSRDWVCAVVFNEYNKKIICVKQFRNGIKDDIIEFPGGIVDEGETSLDAIIREVREEIGVEKNDIVEIIQLYSCNPNPAFFDNRATAYFIKVNSQKLSEQELDDDEEIEILPIGTDEYCILRETMEKNPKVSIMMRTALFEAEKYLKECF